MKLTTEGKTNWKYILIIIIIATIAGGGILAYQYIWEGLFDDYMPVGDVLTRDEIEKEKIIQDETADWKTYSFSVQKLRMIKEQLTPEKQEELEEKIRDQKLENCSFEIKYPQDWTAYTWPLYGVIVPVGLFIEEDPKNHNGCSFQMSFRGDPEKEKYCFPISLFSGGSNQEQCDNIFNQILSTFKFIEKGETVNWNTYRNEDYGYEIKYPSDWYKRYDGDIIEFQNVDGKLYISTGGPCADCVKSEGVRVSIEVKDNFQKLSLNNFVRQQHKWYFDEGLYSTKDRIVGGANALEFVADIDVGADWPNVYIYRGDKIFVVFYAATSGSENYISTFNQMLSTFRFIGAEEIEEGYTNNCIDSDASIRNNQYVKGFVEFNNVKYWDECAGVLNHLQEYYCAWDGSNYRVGDIECPNGCKDGACIE